MPLLTSRFQIEVLIRVPRGLLAPTNIWCPSVYTFYKDVINLLSKLIRKGIILLHGDDSMQLNSRRLSDRSEDVIVQRWIPTHELNGGLVLQSVQDVVVMELFTASQGLWRIETGRNCTSGHGTGYQMNFTEDTTTFTTFFICVTYWWCRETVGQR